MSSCRPYCLPRPSYHDVQTIQVVAGLDFTATGCSCGRRKNTQHNVYLELMHESMMFRNSSCRSAAPAGAACEPQQLPESQPRSPRLHTCPISVSLACFPAGKPARTSGAGYSSCCHGARPTHIAIISTRLLNDSTQRGFRPIVCVSSYMPCYA